MITSALLELPSSSITAKVDVDIKIMSKATMSTSTLT